MRRWGVSVGSLLAGCLTLFVFRRGLPHVGWIIGYLLLLWLLVILVSRIRRPLLDRGRRRVVDVTEYTIQSLYHGLLLFVLPAYYASTTFRSGNVAFLALLIALALLATFDPWYRLVVSPRPWLGAAFLVVSTFAALAVALPLIGARLYPALLTSAGLAVVGVVPAVSLTRGWPLRRALGGALVLAAVAVVIVHVGRAWIPPAPVSLARAAMARSVEDLEPVGPLSTVTVSELQEVGSLVAYTAVYAPASVALRVVHVWRHEGHVVGTLPAASIQGGRRQGFRTYSRKTAFPANSRGRWSVDVMTSSGQLIGRLRFTVID